MSAIHSVKEVDFRLVFLVEDASEQAAYIEKFDTTPRNPLLFDIFANLILQYKDSLWGVIYIGGNSKEKSIEGFTVDELQSMKKQGKLLDSTKFRTMHSKEERFVSKDNENEDRHNVTIKLFDKL